MAKIIAKLRKFNKKLKCKHFVDSLQPGTWMIGQITINQKIF